MRKIDIFNHIWPTNSLTLIGHISQMTDITLQWCGALITDLDRRFEVMDMFGEGYQRADPGLAATREDRRPRKTLELSMVGSIQKRRFVKSTRPIPALEQRP